MGRIRLKSDLCLSAPSVAFFMRTTAADPVLREFAQRASGQTISDELHECIAPQIARHEDPRGPQGGGARWERSARDVGGALRRGTARALGEY